MAAVASDKPGQRERRHDCCLLPHCRLVQTLVVYLIFDPREIVIAASSNRRMEDRKARIAALRAKAGRAKPVEPNNVNANDDVDKSVKPQESVLQVVSLTNSSELQPFAKKQKGEKEEKESVIDLALRQAQAEAKSAPTTAHIEDLAPKKVNADLNREIQPKLDKLEKRTQKAIVALLRERLEQEASAEIDE